MPAPHARAALAVVLVSSAFAVALGSAAEAGPAASRGAGDCATTVIDKAAPAGTDAKRNPLAFRAAAQRNQRGEAAFKDLARDEKLWLDKCGLAFNVEERVQASAAAASTSAPNATVPMADTFTLESKPGSNRTIYLDFTGDTVTGTAWNTTRTAPRSPPSRTPSTPPWPRTSPTPS